MVQGARWRHRIIEHGEGEALLLYHGVGGHADCYARNMKNLGKHFRVIAVDAFYHGCTDEGPWDINKRHDYQVGAIVDLMDALGLEKAHIEGESMGEPAGRRSGWSRSHL
ncbi:alpha/beta fold hydrolase [Streptomyces sp. NPDC002928]|uniref:alpha/beta fold hydrolase n=1 Tax=Streptomyces sp. NPDC002928 TaxID=3154440 RepID=UPI0033A48BA1